MNSFQSALQAGGQYAGGIRNLGFVFFFLLTAIWLLVMGVALISIRRRHRGIEQEPLEHTHRPSPATEAKLTTAVTVAISVTVLIIVGLVTVSVSVGKGIAAPPDADKALAIEVIGNQWWWYVRYTNDQAHNIVVTANEIHIPVGRRVLMRLSSNDVIHSFWVPNLQGKRDLFPGQITTEWIRADRPGRFRGQCAEFCGLQHAHMALWVVAEPEEQFRAWMLRQLQQSTEPTDSEQQHGRQVFMDHACALCHTIRGTDAAGQVGPDLTHLGSRLTIAAGTLTNNKGNLAGWIVDPQNIKPGNHMAMVPLKSEDVQPLIDYLESLQ
jgi:cytochrome c oxidase subunit 2